MEQEQAARWDRAVADTLCAERGIAKLNQAEAARRAGISRSSYRLYEEGARQPDSTQLAAIAEAFGISFIYLMSEVHRRANS